MSAHAASVRTLFTVFGALFILTIITAATARLDMGAMNTPVALGIALLKASLVVWFFMGVRWNTPLTKVVVVAGLFWLLIMFALTMSDYLTRSWIGVPGR